MSKTKRQDGWATNAIGWTNPFGWFGGAKNDKGVTLLPPGAAARGSGAVDGRNPYDFVLPGYSGFNGDPSFTAGIPGSNGFRWPGSYSTYRIMLSHPTVALARATVFAPILASSWVYEGDADFPQSEDAVELIQDVMDKCRADILGTALRCLDFGFQVFEIVWGNDNEGNTIPVKIKPLLPELSVIEVDPNGEITGIRNGDAILKEGEYLLVNYDVEGSNYYGRSRLENIRRSWANYLAIEDQGYLMDRKAAGVVPVIRFPSDNAVPTTDDPYATGGAQSNLAAGRRMGNSLQNMQGVVVENLAGLAVDTPEQAALLAGKSLWGIELLNMGEVGSSQAALLEKLRYYDAMLVRGYLRSERSVIEATNSGSRADSESHTASISDTDCDLVHGMIVEQINRQLINAILVQNFGEKARDAVRIGIRELADERRATLNALLQAALSDPMLRGEMFDRIDIHALMQWAGVKLREDAAPFDEMPTQDERQDDSIDHAAAMAEATGGAVKE